MNWRIPLACPDLRGNERRYVDEAIASSWISSTGAFVDRFETEFAKVCNSGTAIGVANGTVGLHLVMTGLGVGPGDEVIVPSLTYVATANAVAYTGARPVFVDVDPFSWCIDPAGVEAAITPRTVGLIAVHLYGHPADMDALQAIAGRHGLFVVEDAAEAHGARYRDRPVGSLGDASVFSFYGNKILTSGEGGAVTTSDPGLAQRLRLLRGQGMDPNRKYFFPVIGYNYRLTNIACAMLCAQLERFDEMIKKRREISDLYREGLGRVAGVNVQPSAEWAEPVTWLMSITVDPDRFGRDRDRTMECLGEQGIETRPFFIPIHRLPPYEMVPRITLPITESLSKTGINLPTFTSMGEDTVWEVVEALKALS